MAQRLLGREALFWVNFEQLDHQFFALYGQVVKAVYFPFDNPVVHGYFFYFLLASIHEEGLSFVKEVEEAA